MDPNPRFQRDIEKLQYVHVSVQYIAKNTKCYFLTNSDSTEVGKVRFPTVSFKWLTSSYCKSHFIVGNRSKTKISEISSKHMQHTSFGRKSN